MQKSLRTREVFCVELMKCFVEEPHWEPPVMREPGSLFKKEKKTINVTITRAEGACRRSAGYLLRPRSLFCNLTGSGLDRREPLISWGLLPFLLSSYPFLLAFRPALICSTTPVALVRERERERRAHTQWGAANWIADWIGFVCAVVW